MRFSLFTKYGALNSQSIFGAFAEGCKKLGHEIVYDSHHSGDVAVIWSVLWSGRMAPNRLIWESFRSKGKNIIVLEVGSLYRQRTWRVGVNGINREAYFGEKGNPSDRAKHLKLGLAPFKINEDGHILICTQSPLSRQWRNMPNIEEWLVNQIKYIRSQTDRKIIVRCHPRYPVFIPHDVRFKYKIAYQQPNHVKGDVWDLQTKDAYAIVNISSSPAVQAGLWGVPAYVGEESIAYDISNDVMGDYNNPIIPEDTLRRQWLNDLAYTEWTSDEIASGRPLQRLLPYLEQKNFDGET